jgi:hypothetical protein
MNEKIYPKAICKGSIVLHSACMGCDKCAEEWRELRAKGWRIISPHIQVMDITTQEEIASLRSDLERAREELGECLRHRALMNEAPKTGLRPSGIDRFLEAEAWRPMEAYPTKLDPGPDVRWGPRAVLLFPSDVYPEGVAHVGWLEADMWMVIDHEDDRAMLQMTRKCSGGMYRSHDPIGWLPLPFSERDADPKGEDLRSKAEFISSPVCEANSPNHSQGETPNV